MPPPHLHPRSRMTSSLFATTVLASFFVVALPHILPCPAPARRVYYADNGEMPAGPGGETADSEQGRRRRRVVRTRTRTRTEAPSDEDGAGMSGSGREEGDGGIGIVEFRPEGEGRRRNRVQRECPVPKPGGVLGEWLGFHGGGAAAGEGGERRER